MMRLMIAGLLVTALLPTLLVKAAPSAPGDLMLPRAEGSMSAESMPPSVFPHWIHRVNYRCDACHKRLFEMELGATEITMDMMRKGESCGTCHNDEIAFGVQLETCETCHVPPAP